MRDYIFREEEESKSGSGLFLIIGALAGLAAGIYIAERYGGFSAIADKLKDRLGSARDDLDDDLDSDFEYDEDDEMDESVESNRPMSASEELEERVLEAFRNDPILSERAVDIGAIEDGIVELTGWVNAEDESHHAVTLTRGVPGVETVVNRLAVRDEEDLYDEMSARYEDGDPALTEGHWEGQQVGTGRRRQGNSEEPDRHADPKPILENKSLRQDAAFESAAEDMPAAERRANQNKQGRKRAD